MTCPDCERMREALRLLVRRNRKEMCEQPCSCAFCRDTKAAERTLERAALAPEPAPAKHESCPDNPCPAVFPYCEDPVATPEPEGAKHLIPETQCVCGYYASFSPCARCGAVVPPQSSFLETDGPSNEPRHDKDCDHVRCNHCLCTCGAPSVNALGEPRNPAKTGPLDTE